jgi:hypothetical protein
MNQPQNWPFTLGTESLGTNRGSPAASITTIPKIAVCVAGIDGAANPFRGFEPD